MKKNYWKNLYLSQLKSKSPIEVYKACASRIRDTELLNTIVSLLGKDDLDEFFTILAATAYNLEDTNIHTLLFKHPIKNSTYELLKREYSWYLRRILPLKVHLPLDLPGDEFILNHCLILEMALDIAEITLDKIGRIRAGWLKDKRYFSIIRKAVYNTMTEIPREDLKDPLLVAIVDACGRVNANEYSLDDLLLVQSFQVYNLSEKKKTLLLLCQNRSVDGVCSICGRKSTKADEQIPDVPTMSEILDDSIAEGDVETTHRVLQHVPDLRDCRHLKILLKNYLTDSSNQSTVKDSNSHRNTISFYCNTFSLFHMDLDCETTVISFFKSIDPKTQSVFAIKLIPCFMKSKRLFFAAFVILTQSFKLNRFVSLVVRNIVQRFQKEFESIIDMILEYQFKVLDAKNTRFYSTTNKEYLCEKLSTLSEMFSTTPELFLAKNIYFVFNTFYPSPHFTSEFNDSNIKFVVIQGILDSTYTEQVDDVDILVGLLFLNCFTGLNVFFKPTVSYFIRKNFSHILFKIKNVYMLGIYGKRTCIYRIMKFILEQVTIKLYFSYIWPYVEFFLNKEYCGCAGYFLEWLQQYQNSSMMCPYLIRPFESIEDLPRLANLEMKIYEILARFFSPETKAFEISDCPYTDVSKSKAVESTEIRMDTQASEDTLSHNAVYRLVRDAVPGYNPRPLISDELFINRFLHFYKESRSFRSKIHTLNASLPLSSRALFGDLKCCESSGTLPKAPSDIPQTILRNFLFKINYERQDLFAFTIQEFLKSIPESFEPEIEDFVQQFRHTKFEYKFTLKPVKSLDFSSFRTFLESIFTLLYFKTRKYQFLKYLILFDDATVEFACLCLTKMVTDDGHQDHHGYFNGINTSNPDILKFLLKVNTFVGHPIVEKQSFVEYALKAKDFYSLIYALEDEDTDYELLQIAYYMVNDPVRVKAFNNIPKAYTTLNLFFDFILDKNYKTALAISKSIVDHGIKAIGSAESVIDSSSTVSSVVYRPKRMNSGSLISTLLNTNTNITNYSSANTNYSSNTTYPQRLAFISKSLKEILDSNNEEDAESILQGKDVGVILHVIKDMELLIQSSNPGEAVRMITERRSISRSPDTILKIHKFLESKLNLEAFSRSVDLELIRFLIEKKEYQRAEEEIARMVLNSEYCVLIEHAHIKMDQKCLNEAKELLKRARQLCKSDSIDYFKATVKFCEISQSKSTFEECVEDLEAKFQKQIGNEKSVKISKKSMLSKVYQKFNSQEILECRKDTVEFYTQLQKLYFLTAKYFEKYDTMISIKYYFKSLTSNHESIPRFFHLISGVARVHLKIVGEMIETIKKEYLSNLIPFYNQICTKIALDSETVKFFKDVLSAMLEAYPHHTHWNSLFLYNSKKIEVSKIVESAVENLSIEKKMHFVHVKSCSEKFTNIARNSSPRLSMENFPEIRGFFPCSVNVPGQMTEINNIKNEIIVFKSLQMPKKITLVGEDGVEYAMIVKFKDDLRKDSRFMDLDDLLNKLFDDGFYIRRYNVIPFNHESGIIEFVPNLCNLRGIVQGYHEITHETLQKFLRTKIVGVNNMEAMMLKFPPVYGRYLKDKYTDPCEYYRCRENYIRTYAIMNIVGWFMGLGDRHTENIHFDTLTGDTVHVDLNCIFDKGKALEIPEKVPFRLTQNIVDGFGILKLEGTYKNTLKYTLNLMKSNRDVIQANLLSFVFDPLFEWARKKTEPIKMIEAMNNRLDFEDVDLKIEELIREATDLSNLGSMYIGWMSFV